MEIDRSYDEGGIPVQRRSTKPSGGIYSLSDLENAVAGARQFCEEMAKAAAGARRFCDETAQALAGARRFYGKMRPGQLGTGADLPAAAHVWTRGRAQD